MRKYLYKILPLLGFILLGMQGCEQDKKGSDSRLFLLTNDSVKTWNLYKIINSDSYTIFPYSCIVDDEYKFYMNGTLTIHNMGTTFVQFDASFIAPITCKDTLPITQTKYWEFNANKDSLIISSEHTVQKVKIVKLIYDTLVFKRFYADTLEQTEYYVHAIAD